MRREILLVCSGCVGLLLLGGFQVSIVTGQKLQQKLAEPTNPCFESTCREAPLRETLTAIDLHTQHLDTDYVRGIFGGFQQGAGIAGGVQGTTAALIPHMELRAAALTSTSFARRFDLEGVFGIRSRNHADAWFSHMQRQNSFFGVGPRTPNQPRTTFTTDQRSYQASLYRDIADRLQGGIYVQVMNSHTGPGDNPKEPSIADTYSGKPDQPIDGWIPGLLSTTQILSYGAFMAYDTRDKSVDLTRGVDLFVRLASNDGMNGHAEFADYGWLEGEFDARGYIPLGGSRTSFAARARGQFKAPKGGSQIPFYDLSYLGGRESLRGYQSYRFRANNLLMLSTELRQTVYKTSDHRGVDIFALADIGQVWGDARSTTDAVILANRQFLWSNWRSGVGGGLQYRHSVSLAARLEAAHSNERNQIYASLSRGF